MAHQVLQGLGIHTRPCHVAAVGMAANVRRDIRYLNPIDIIVALHHVVETVLPVHGHQGHTSFVYEKKSAVSVYHSFRELRLAPVFQDPGKAIGYLISYRYPSHTGVRLRRFNVVAHIGVPLELVINIHRFTLKVDILHRKAAELRNSHAGMEKDK